MQILTKKCDHLHTQILVFWILHRKMMTKGLSLEKNGERKIIFILVLFLASNIEINTYLDSNMKHIGKDQT